MKPLNETMAREVGNALREAELAHIKCTVLIGTPRNRKPEELEDALNELQDAAYRARRAFRVESVR